MEKIQKIIKKKISIKETKHKLSTQIIGDGFPKFEVLCNYISDGVILLDIYSDEIDFWQHNVLEGSYHSNKIDCPTISVQSQLEIKEIDFYFDCFGQGWYIHSKRKDERCISVCLTNSQHKNDTKA